jgi:single-strand DNA-binding protein
LKGYLFMASFNRIIIAGNLTRDPEYKQLSSGQSVTRLGLASNRNYKNRQTGMLIQEVCFVDIDVFGPQADSCNQYLQKGRAVLVEGRLKFDTWQSPEGQTRSKHSIVADRVVFLGGQQADDLQQTQQQQPTDPAVAAVQEQVKKVKAAKKVKPESHEVDESAEDSHDQSSESKTEQNGEFAFTDEPPFQDDLPF